MNRRRALCFGPAVLVLLLMSACACMMKSATVRMPEATVAVTVLRPTKGNTAKGIIVHADADDLKSQPTGNAGARIAFGIIGIARSAE